MTDFESVDLKLGRAKEHFTTFEAELATYYKSEPIRPKPLAKTDPSREPFTVAILHAPPAALSLTFGDFVHNMRSTLDHLAMALALDNDADPQDTTIQFPICDHPDRYFGSPGEKSKERPSTPPRGTGGFSVRALTPEAQTFVEGFQPYHKGKESWTLTELQFLDNMDKHRNILRTKMVPTAYVETPGVKTEWATPVPDLVDGVLFATVIYPTGYTGVQVYPDFFAQICVEHSRWPSGVNEAKSFGREFLIPHVERIVREAKSHFS